jgi:hypothetical protein
MAPPGDPPDPWSVLVGGVLKPPKVEILEAMRVIDRPLAPVELYRVFEEQVKLPTLAYHVKCLRELEALVKVSEYQVRGGRATRYRLR